MNICLKNIHRLNKRYKFKNNIMKDVYLMIFIKI